MFRMSGLSMKLKKRPLRVYLGTKESIEYPAPIRRRVEDHFRRVVRSSGKFDGVEVSWTSIAPKLAKHDLLVYFVRSPSKSVVKKLWAGATLGDTGTTVIGTIDVASEVYLDGNQDDPYGLANVAVHELMHNVTKMKNELHTQKGISLAKEEVTADTAMSPGDLDLMVDNLTLSRRQWVGGF